MVLIFLVVACRINEIRLRREHIPRRVAFEKYIALDTFLAKVIHPSSSVRDDELPNCLCIQPMASARHTVAFDQKGHSANSPDSSSPNLHQHRIFPCWL